MAAKSLVGSLISSLQPELTPTVVAVSSVSFFTLLFIVAVMLHKQDSSKQCRVRADEELITCHPSSPGPRQRRASFAQPTFEERAISIRQISFSPSEPDVVQSIKCITSTLATTDDPKSDMLPYGGRKSSSASKTSGFPLQQVSGVVSSPSERQCLVAGTGDTEDDKLELRRVSIGGEEDVVKFRSPSIALSTFRRKSSHVLTAPPSSMDPNNSSTPVPAFMPQSPHPDQTTHKDMSLLGATELSEDSSAWEAPEDMPPTTTESIGEVFHAWHGFPATETPEAVPSLRGIQERPEKRCSMRFRAGKITHLAELTKMEGMSHAEGGDRVD